MELAGVRGPELPVRLLPPSKVKPAQPGKDFLSTDLARRLHAMPESGALWLLDTEFAFVDVDGTTGHFTRVDELGKGRHQSRRQVGFGQLVLSGAVRTEQTELVAVKPTSPELAAREFGAMNTLNALYSAVHPGRLLSFEPVGFMRAPDQSGVSLLTRYDHPVRTLDLVMWDPDQPPSESQARAALSECALALATVHGSKIAWCDAQPKNVGSDSEGVRCVDFEEAADLTGPGGEIQPGRARRLIVEDLESLLGSLGGDYVDLVEEGFAAPYCQAVEASGTLPNEVLVGQAAVMRIAQQPQRPLPIFPS
jgi:hypothetical protein